MKHEINEMMKRHSKLTPYQIAKQNSALLEALKIVNQYFTKVWGQDALGIEGEIWGKVIEAITNAETK